MKNALSLYIPETLENFQKLHTVCYLYPPDFMYFKYFKGEIQNSDCRKCYRFVY